MASRVVTSQLKEPRVSNSKLNLGLELATEFRVLTKQRDRVIKIPIRPAITSIGITKVVCKIDHLIIRNTFLPVLPLGLGD